MNKIEIDNYTKGILTLIALCLFLLTMQQFNLFPKAYADGAKNQILLPNANYGLVPLNEDGSINVRLIANDELDVNIVGVDTYDELEVKLMSINTSDELDVNLVSKFILTLFRIWVEFVLNCTLSCHL